MKGVVVAGETRVLVPGRGPGLVIEVRQRQGERALVLVELDNDLPEAKGVALRTWRYYDQLEPE